MKIKYFIPLLMLANLSFAQNSSSISIIDFVKIRAGKQKEAIYYYENNWKVFREIALDKGYIKSYRLLLTTADSTANFDILLFTEYTDSVQLNLSEERFQRIIKETRPNDSKLLNDFKPVDFRQNLFFKRTETLFSADRSKLK